MMTPDTGFLGPNRSCSAVLLGFLAVLLIVSGPAAFASPTSSISGTIVDPSGAVVAGATVILHDTEHGAHQRSTTNNDGSYTFPALAPGHYYIEIHSPG